MIMKKRFLIFVICSIIFAVQLTSCRNDKIDDVAADIEKEHKTEESSAGAVSPIGLTYHNFISDDDVEILDSDTTEISVSRALAERLGVESFLNHPISVWQRINNMPYMRRVIGEKITDDRFILKVEHATVAEVLGGVNVDMQTDFFVRHDDNGALRAGADKPLDMERLSAHYRDDNNVLHPVVALMTDPYGYDKPVHYSDEQPPANSLKSAADGYQYYTAEQMTGDGLRLASSGKLLSVYTELEKKFYFVFGDHADSITVWLTCPLTFQLNYKFNINTYWKHEYLFLYTPRLKSLDMGMDGLIDINPQLTIGYQAKYKLPDDKRIMNIAKFNGYTFVFMVGPIPIPISIKPTLDIVFFAQFSAKASTRIEYEFKKSFNFGCTYNEGKGWDTYSDSRVEKNGGKFYPSRVDFKAIASAGLMFGSEVNICGVSGPQISIGPQFLLNSKLTLYPTDKKRPYVFRGDLDFSMYLLMFAKLQLFGFHIADWNTYASIGPSWNIWHYDSDEQGHDDKDLKMLENEEL